MFSKDAVTVKLEYFEFVMSENVRGWRRGGGLYVRVDRRRDCWML